MKQRGTQQNRPKKTTCHVRTTTDTVDGVHSSVPSDTGRKVQNRTANGTSIPVAQAGRMLGLDRRTIRRMCDEGSVQCFATRADTGASRLLTSKRCGAVMLTRSDPL
jgi:hypothetical protein